MATQKVDRAVTSEEQSLRWLFDHSQHVRYPEYAKHIDDLRVISRCDCGCASIDFAVGGRAPQTHGIQDVTDEFYWSSPEGHLYAVIAYAKDDLLAGLEVYSVDGLSIPSRLPDPATLRTVL